MRGVISAREANVFTRLVARDHVLNSMTSEDHADARKKGGLVDRLGKLEKLSPDDEELARSAERKVAVALVAQLVDGNQIDAKTARSLLETLVDMTDHDVPGDDDGSIALVLLMALLAGDDLKPAPSKSTTARDAPDAVSEQEADQFKRRNRR